MGEMLYSEPQNSFTQNSDFFGRQLPRRNEAAGTFWPDRFTHNTQLSNYGLLLLPPLDEPPLEPLDPELPVPELLGLVELPELPPELPAPYPELPELPELPPCKPLLFLLV
jgi:hypothetical protein